MSYTYNERDSKWFSNTVVSINPSLLWRIFPNTELTVEYEYLDIETNFGALQPDRLGAARHNRRGGGQE